MTDPAPDPTTDWTTIEDPPPPPPPAGLDLSLAKEYARLRRVERARGAEAKAAKEAADKIEEQLIEEMVQATTDQIRIDGTTIHFSTRIAANKSPEVDAETFHAALRAVGLGHIIKPAVSAQTLAAYARELRDADKPLPPELQGVLNIHEITRLGTRSSS